MTSIGWQPGRSSTPSPRLAVLVGVLVALVVAVVALLWAKWLPYGAEIASLRDSHAWSGSSILTHGGVRPGDPPSWHAASSFAGTYLRAVWKALVAALVISAAIQALVPRDWLVRTMNRRTDLGAATVGGLLSTPSMMCTCCTAPVAVTLRRDGVRTAAVVAYWLGNPLLNPAVLVFLALVAPWQWTVTRLVVGLFVVVGGSTLVGRVARGDGLPAEPVLPRPGSSSTSPGSAARRFVGTLARLSVVLVPEYVLVVLVVGALRGWLFPIGSGAVHEGVAVVLLASLVGTLLVLPTAGEIPVLQGLALAGLSLGGVGALLLTLPAASLPAMAMLGRTLGWRTTAATAATVAVGGIAAGALLAVLS